MSALRLKADPTFKAKVKIPAPGGDSLEFTGEFKHRTKDQLDAFFTPAEAEQRKGDVDDILAMVVGWDLADEPFSRDAVVLLVQNYHAAPRVIAETYIRELTQARLGN